MQKCEMRSAMPTNQPTKKFEDFFVLFCFILDAAHLTQSFTVHASRMPFEEVVGADDERTHHAKPHTPVLRLLFSLSACLSPFWL